jgi:hypothetical protein
LTSITGKGDFMKNWTVRLFAIAAPLMLGGCLWGPGKFTSDLTLRKNGTFVLDYRGEIMLQMPDDKGAPPLPWEDNMARCYTDGRTEIVDTELKLEPADEAETSPGDDEKRACTAAETARLKAQYQKESAEKIEQRRKESDNVAKMLGLPTTDDESNRRFAASLMKYQGWRSVTYKGKGLFDVDYHFEGRVGQDYVFPMMPESDIVIPFVTIRKRTDGSVTVTAPALTGGQGPFGARAKMMGLPNKGEGPPSRAEGRFTITTDGEILTNNSEDGPVAGPSGKSVRWDVSPATNKIPEMLVRL